MERLPLAAKKRTSLGSGASRRVRRQGQVPAVLYGHGEPTSLLVDEREFRQLLQKSGGETPLVNLTVDGSVQEMAIVRDVQYHPIARRVQHVDLQRVEMTEKIETEVHLVVEGVSPAVKLGGIYVQIARGIEVRALPSNIPENVKIDLSMLKNIGDSIHAGDLVLPEGVELLTPADATLVTVQAPSVAEVEGEAAAETPAEPEVVGKGKEEKAE